MEIQEMLKEIAAAGFRVSNLYQAEDGTWRCNLCKDFPAVEGKTIEDALKRARDAVGE